MQAKLLFVTIFLLLFNSYLVNSQCVPAVLSAPGLQPPASQALPSGGASEPYQTEVNFRFKAPATIVPSDLGVPTIPGFNTNLPMDFQPDYYLLVVQGLPNGITKSCNTSNCQYLDDQTGCVVLSGIPTAIGSYDVTIAADFYGTAIGDGNLGLTGLPNEIPVGGSLTLPAIPPLLAGGTFQISPVRVSYGTHKMVITATSVFEVENREFYTQANFPNPFTSYTDIVIFSKEISDVSLKIFNSEGKLVKADLIRKVSGEYNYRLLSDGLAQGIYFCHIESRGKKSVFKIVVN